LERLAVVDVRPSTMPHVCDHQESTRLPDGLVQRAVAWGGPEARGLVIDAALGRSGTSAESRHGVQRLVADVGLDHVGLLVGVEMSRVARSSRDWPQLWEICARCGTLIADLDGLDDPRHENERLVWG
jgi:DNA invertase Pin-like site-specific DNA recombinase